MAKQGVLRTKAAAEYLGVSMSWLEKLRRQLQGPRVVRLGKRAIGYTIADLDRWIQKRRSDTHGTGR